MPPRKKAAANGTAAPTRSSTRIKANGKDAAAPAKPASKAKTKRALSPEDDDDEDDTPPAKKPTSKKTTKPKPDDDEEADTKDDEPEKIVTVLKRGAAPVDPQSGKVHSHQVYANDEGVWDAMLNQTDISGGSNKNKFYVLQLLHPISSNAASAAISEFKKQFKSKAGVAWEARVGMVPKKGKYVWLERDFAEDDEKDEAGKDGGSEIPAEKEKQPIPDSVLAPQVQDFCKLIFSTSIIDATLSSMNYDARKLPLGKLSKATILSGFNALKTLSEVLDDPGCDAVEQNGGNQRAAIEQLTGAYYSIIPHDFGRQRPMVIDTKQRLQRELEIVDALGDMEIASKIIASSTSTDTDGAPINPIDAQFNSLGLSKMEPLARDSQEFLTLETYVRDTHGHTHSHIHAEVQHIYRIERPGEQERWEQGGFHKVDEGERLLLWHGSRTTNFAGILSQGLRIAPPEAPVNGYMFGKGVYFADMMSKSAGYCYSGLSNNTGILLLCEVVAKPFYERNDAEYNADQTCKQNNKRATKGLGRTQPMKWKDAGKSLGNDELIGCEMPDGGGSDVATGGYLQYNEYIVYDIAQIRTKYLLMVKM
ncbi:poly polymerase catalytic domain-containing protein [Armillaria luteobubalina]|uniref:Poly [ADP-ribose] polymerase n=1 Tax=Armillaria luteobubalina TaxID=153913 RepID=A0AA39QQZ5_9AGAR|nr:poly polymerase catalytic domain-containing protein [Armillaria luteobubalina]